MTPFTIHYFSKTGSMEKLVQVTTGWAQEDAFQAIERDWAAFKESGKPQTGHYMYFPYGGMYSEAPNENTVPTNHLMIDFSKLAAIT